MSWIYRLPVLKPYELAVLKASADRIEIVVAGHEKQYFIWFVNNAESVYADRPQWKHYIHYLNCNRAESVGITDRQRLNLYNFLLDKVFKKDEITWSAAAKFKQGHKNKYEWVNKAKSSDEFEDEDDDSGVGDLEGNPSDYGDRD